MAGTGALTSGASRATEPAAERGSQDEIRHPVKGAFGPTFRSLYSVGSHDKP